MARKLGPAQPRGTTWNGAGGWVIVSQSRQANFSRTVWITFHALGITSSVSVISSPSFDSRLPPHAGHEHGAARTIRSRGRCSGNAFLTGGLRSKLRTLAVFSAAATATRASSLASVSSSSSCSSIWSSRRRVRSALAPYCSRFSLAICSLRCAMSASRALSRATALASLASASSAREMAAATSALSASRSLGRADMAGTTNRVNHRDRLAARSKCRGEQPIRRSGDASYTAGYASRCRRACRPVERRSATRHAVGRRWPDEATLLEALGIERHADPVVPDDLKQRSGASAKHVQIAGERIAA